MKSVMKVLNGCWNQAGTFTPSAWAVLVLAVRELFPACPAQHVWTSAKEIDGNEMQQLHLISAKETDGNEMQQPYFISAQEIDGNEMQHLYLISAKEIDGNEMQQLNFISAKQTSIHLFQGKKAWGKNISTVI